MTAARHQASAIASAEERERKRANKIILGGFSVAAFLGVVLFARAVTRPDTDPRAIAPIAPESAEEAALMPDEPALAAAASRALSPAQIRGVLSSREQDVTTCYPRAGEAPARVDLTLRVEPDGAVSRARVETEVASPVARCLETKTRAWRFPADPRRAPQDVTVPLVLVPSQS